MITTRFIARFGLLALLLIASAMAFVPQDASAQCCAGGPCGACDACAILPFGCYYQGYYEGYYQSYYEGYYQSYYEGYYQSYYEGYYQGYYQSYYEGYYQSYYEGYYQSYYEGYYQSYYEGAYALGPDLTATYLSPSSASAGSVTLQGRATNSGDSTAGSFSSYFEVQGNGTLTWTSAVAGLGAGVSTNVSANRTLSAGSYQVRLCVDGGGTVSESNEGNNCSAWSPLSISGGAVSATLTANPTSIASGESSTLTWSSTNATSCTPASGNFATGGATSGSVSVSPASDATYIVQCTGPGGNDTDDAEVTVTGGAGSCTDTGPLTITAEPSRIQPGEDVDLSWTAADVSAASCTLTNLSTGDELDSGAVASCGASGSFAIADLEAQTTYRLTCGSLFKDVTVNIVPRYEEF